MMIPEKRFLNQIQQVLARLMQPLWLLDTEGTVLLPEENRSKINLPEFMEPGMPVAFEGKTFLMIGITPELILCADAQGAATHDCIVLAGAMVQSMGRGEAPIQSRYDVYRRVLREELAGSELEALAHEHQIEMNRERCVLTFQILQTETETAFNMLEELVPRAGGDLLAVSLELGSRMLVAAGIAENVEDGKARMKRALESGAGLEKLKEMIAAQGGDAGVCDDVTRLPQAKYLVPVPAPHDGYVADMDTTAIGYCAQDLGAGRKQKTDAIDPAVGLVMDVRIGDFVKQGDALATLHLNRMELAEGAIARMQQAVRLTSEKPATPPLVYAAVSPRFQHFHLKPYNCFSAANIFWERFTQYSVSSCVSWVSFSENILGGSLFKQQNYIVSP